SEGGRRGSQGLASFGIDRGVERYYHGVLAAGAEVRTLQAVGDNLLDQPRVRHDREAHVNEVRRHMREGAELVEAFASGASPKLFDNHRAGAIAPFRGVDR